MLEFLRSNEIARSFKVLFERRLLGVLKVMAPLVEDLLRDQIRFLVHHEHVEGCESVIQRNWSIEDVLARGMMPVPAAKNCVFWV